MDEIEALEREAIGAIDQADTEADVRLVQSRYFGKNGLFSPLLRSLGSITDPDAKRAAGFRLNEVKASLGALIEARAGVLRRRERETQFEAERIDVTMPGRTSRVGYEHVLQQTANRVKAVLSGLGFEYREGPELELFQYNFEALNYPPDHPAMDDQDTFYIDDEHLLRTQCTALQGRTFENTKPPLRVFTIGRCYRNEAVDRTHGHTFHQVDCFMIDRKVSMAHLKGTLGLFARSMFGSEVKLRFRPDFFPFVEPGVDYAISTPKLFGGKWVELGGAGLIHPKILRNFGIDSDQYSGFAFGLGIERIPMMSLGVDDLRPFLENDLRFLSQFRREAPLPQIG